MRSIRTSGIHDQSTREIVDGPQRREANSRWTLILCCLAVTPCAAVEPTPDNQRQVDGSTSFLTTHCIACHQGSKPEGNLRLDALSTDFSQPRILAQWRTIRKRVAAGEMPPADHPRPEREAIAAFLETIDRRVTAVETEQRRQTGRVTWRRLNRVAYENTLGDLLGVKVAVQDLLPLDGSQAGFDHVGEALHTSSFLLERYLEAAQMALDVAIANTPQPPLIQKRYSLQETHQVRVTTEKVFRKHEDGGVVMFCSSPWQSVSLTPFYPPDRGDYRFRIATRGVQSGGKPVTFRVDAGLMLMTGRQHLVGYFDSAPETQTIIEFVDWLEPRNTIRLLPYGLPSAQTVNQIGAETYQGPGLAVDWIEVEGPLFDAWPPESHRRIFGDLPQQPSGDNRNSRRLEVVSTNPQTDAQRILQNFLRRAFRRAVTAEDVAPFLSLFENKLAEGRTFEQAIRVALSAILVAPEFLFLRETPGVLDDFALASRLSYFLWNTLPDDELLTLAEQHQLRRPEVLRAQVERLLTDPRSSRFVENFVGQWLGLRDIDFTAPSHLLHPEFDQMLKVSMVREAELFFAELLKEDLSITNFLAADFSMLNGRLARHYGIPGVDGWEFRKTSLPADSHRGGVLTMAGVLKVTANGTSTSPVMRGAWVLERILGTPAPPPPADVGSIEPDIRGATTIREQLAKHRDVESCAACHRLIDPPGFALENFDVIGGYRERYRTTGNGQPVTIDDRKMPYRLGLPVDPSGALADGRAFRNIDEFKQRLLEDDELFACAFTTKLVIYATGGTLDSIDEPQIAALATTLRAQGSGLRSLIHAIVASPLFLEK